MYINYRGVIPSNDPLLNYGLVHLDHITLASGSYLYASTGGSGGLVTLALQENGSLAGRVDQDYFPESAWPVVGHGLASLAVDGAAYAFVGGDGSNELLAYQINDCDRRGVGQHRRAHRGLCGRGRSW